MSEHSQHGFVPLSSLTGGSHHRRTYWQSIAEYEGNLPPEAEAEEPGAEGIEISAASRRKFLSLMAGSLALAGLTGCTRQPVERIMPYVDPPENVIPGKPKWYATATTVNGVAQGVIVESHLGRPTKVEGNPAHPASLGATSVLSQACLMDLYDPDRSREIMNLGVPRNWEAFQEAWMSAIAPIQARNGEGFRILTETVISPSLGDRIQAVLKKFPAAKWHQFDPAGPHSARAAAQSVFGRPVNTYYKFDNADVVVALDADFLACGSASTRYARDFSVRRRRGDRLDMNRLYAIESTMTATGGKADHRLALRYADVEAFAFALAARLGVPGLAAAPQNSYAGWLNVLVSDLQANRGASIIIPGEQQTPEVHALAHLLNAALGNVGKTVIYTDPIEIQPVDQLQSLGEIVRDMQDGKVELLVILGGNPVYNAPADLHFAPALERVKTSVHAGLHYDETSQQTTWHIPESHFLEEWGDARAFDGTVTIQQPLILPLYASFSFLQILDAMVAWPGRPSYDIVRAYWSARSGAGDFEHWWRKTVHDGLIEGSALHLIQVTPRGAAPQQKQAAESGLEIVFRPDVYLYDGRYANNIWLQELPHPMTKLTWDNAVILSPRTAKRLRCDNQQHVKLQLGANSVWGSVWILPGHPDETVTVDLGWGRSMSGRAGNGAGFNAYALRTSDAFWRGTGAKIRKLDTPYPLATTQMQQYMMDRDVVIENTVDGYRQNPDFARQKEHTPEENLTLYPHWSYEGYAWSMAIDLTACVNCNACVIACQAENNIAVVGKQQVLARRAMHWLRIDVYYKGGMELPSAYYCPVPCMQCENAPCELVCPVQATQHSYDGLNDMVYNRCIGTRYCSNNCPWKVRRFNFLLFQDWNTPTLKMQRNPDVSVRSRGVMEKCTYCVQRIREAEITARNEDRYIRDYEIQTACMQACPTEAIIFGDKNNPVNRVAQLKAEPLNYAMYSELNTRPRTTYLAEIRNPHPGLKEGTSA